LHPGTATSFNLSNIMGPGLINIQMAEEFSFD
jgi:hypothetical protein